MRDLEGTLKLSPLGNLFLAHKATHREVGHFQPQSIPPALCKLSIYQNPSNQCLSLLVNPNIHNTALLCDQQEPILKAIELTTRADVISAFVPQSHLFCVSYPLSLYEKFPFIRQSCTIDPISMQFRRCCQVQVMTSVQTTSGR